MKSIAIKGKHHKDKIAKTIDSTTIAVRDCMLNMPLYVFDNAFQVVLINTIYLDLDKDLDKCKYKKECLREIDKKIASYKVQDINRNKYNNNNITRIETVEKLVASKLRCYYCKSEMLIFYNKVRDVTQWTLDRIDNILPHLCENVVVCCLKCNLQRRCQNNEKFLFSKQLKIVKTNF